MVECLLLLKQDILSLPPVDEKMVERIKSITEHALDSLGIKYGASHTEVKVNKDGAIRTDIELFNNMIYW